MFTGEFFIICISVFVASIGLGIIVPILPLYADGLGATGFLLGLIYSGLFISMTICNPIVGRLSDRIGKKTFITCGFGLGIIIALSYVWATSPFDLVIVRLLHGIIAAMIIPVLMAYVGELSPMGKEGSYMGVYTMALFLGMAAGPVIGGIIVDIAGMNFAFYSFASSMGIAFFLTLFFLPSRPPFVSHKASKSPVKQILASNPLKGLFVFGFILAIAQSGIAVFLPLLANNQQLTKTQIGILASAFIFVAGILQPYFGRLSNKYNKVNMVLIGTLIIAIGLAYLPSTNGFWILLFVGILIGIAAAIASPAANAMIVEHSREIGMGVVAGTMTACNSLGMIIGPIGAGIVMDKINLNSAFYLYSLIFIIGTALFYYFTRETSHPIIDTHYDKYPE